MDRRLLVREWRAATTGAVAVAAAAVVLRLRLPLDDGWLLAVLGAVLLVAIAVVLVPIYRGPPAPAVSLSRWTADEIAAATTQVRHGDPVAPRELQAAAIDRARRGLRSGLLTMASFSMTGASLAIDATLQHRHGSVVFFTVAGTVMIAAGLGMLAQGGRLQHRLNHLDDTTAADPARPPEPGGQTHPPEHR